MTEIQLFELMEVYIPLGTVYARFLLGGAIAVLCFLWGHYWLTAIMTVAVFTPLPKHPSALLVLGATIYAGIIKQWWFVIGTTGYALIPIVGALLVGMVKERVKRRWSRKE